MDDIIPENKSHIHANVLNIVYRLMSEHVWACEMHSDSIDFQDFRVLVQDLNIIPSEMVIDEFKREESCTRLEQVCGHACVRVLINGVWTEIYRGDIHVSSSILFSQIMSSKDKILQFLTQQADTCSSGHQELKASASPI